MENQILTEKAELERIVDASSAVLYRAEWHGEDTGYVATYVSASITAMLGYERQACLQPGWWFDHLHPDDERQVTANMKRLQEQGEIDHVYRFADASGAYRWIRDHVRLHKGVDGKPDEIIGSWVDITESRTAEQRLFESEEMYRTLVEQSFDGIVILAADGAITFANQACADAWGGKVEELTNKSMFDIVHADELERMQLYFDQRIRGGGPLKPYETRMLRKNGETAWMESTGRLITWQDQPADLLTLRDITERKQKEALLARRERQLAVLAEAGKSINETLDKQQIARKLVDYARRLVDCESGTVGLYRHEKLCFREYTKADKTVPIELDFPLDYGVPGFVMATKIPYTSADALNDAHVIPEIQQSLGFIKLIDVPILDNGEELLGCFEMHDRLDGADFDAQDMEMLQSLAGIVAAALVNARQQTEIEQAADRMRRILNADFDAVIVHQDMRVVFSNKAAQTMFGFTSLQETIGVNPQGFMDPAFKSLAAAIYRKVIRTGRPSKRMELGGIHQGDGRISIFPMEVASTPIHWEGKPAIVSIFRDITERKQMMERLTASEQYFKTVVEANPSATVITRLGDGQLLFANDALRKMFRVDHEDIVSLASPQYYAHPEDREMLLQQLKDKTNVQHEIECKRGDGSTFWAAVSASLMVFEGAQAIIAVFANVTEHIMLIQALENSESRYHKLVDILPDALIVHQDGKVVFANPSAAQMFGYASAEATTGQPLINHIHPDDRELVVRRISGVIEKNADAPLIQEHFLKLDGSDVWAETTGTPIEFEGKPAVMAVLRDVSDSRQALEALKKAHARHDEAQRIAHLGHWELNPETDQLDWSDEVFRIFEIDPAQFGASYEDFLNLIHPDDREMVDRAYRESVKNHTQYQSEHRLLMADGRIKWVQERCETEYSADGAPLRSLGTVLDITQRRQQEQQLRLLESAVASINESIVITDLESTIVYVNPSFERNTGYLVEDAIGKTPAILNSKQQSKAFYAQFWNTISHGKPWAGRILDRRKDGTIFPVHLSVAPVFNEQGEITHYVAVHEDLSQAESLQKKIAQAQKMEAVGTMVGGVAHDFNNMLASIVGNFYLIRRHFPDDVELQQRISSMEQATGHGAKLIRQMLTFARKDTTDMHALTLSTFFKEAHKLADAAMPENIRLDLNITDAAGVCVKADATQLQQVILNLVTNARHAVEDRFGEHGQGVVSLKLSCDQPNPALLMDHSAMLSENDWVCMRCTDNGCGIKADDLQHVFEPFFTTKEQGRGTGLGLSMVYGAVETHHGLIDIDSKPGEGTTISIWLPQHSAEVAEVVGEDTVDVDGSGRMVLLADDEEGLRKVLVEVLQHHAFSVLQANDGEQAVAQFEKYRDEIALVLMDVVMPNKGGVVAAQEIRAIDADVPIIFQTGYGEQTQLDAANTISNSASLQKPVHIPDMLKMIMMQIRD